MLKKVLHILFFLTITVHSQELSFVAKTDKSTFEVGEKFFVSYVLNAQGDNFEEPSFDGFLAEGPRISISNENYSSIINGKKVNKRKATVELKFLLTPKKKGNFIIQPAKITYKGTVYKSNSLQINVVESSVPQQVSPNLVGNDFIVIAETNKTNYYLYEPIKVKYRVYFDPNAGIENITLSSKPKYSDFWSFFEENKNINPSQVTFKGKQYGSFIYAESVLYPLKTGNLLLDPIALDFQILKDDSRSFFGQIINKLILSNQKNIQVDAIPANNEFSQSKAVGNFSFNTSVSKNKLKFGESFDLKLEVSGNGNLKFLELPTQNWTSNFDVFEPKHEETVDNNLDLGMFGKVSDVYTIIPQSKGIHAIPSIEFTYFEPISKSFKTIKTEPIQIEVEDGPGLDATAKTTAKNATIEKPKVFQYIQKNTHLKSKNDKGFFGSWLYFVMLFLPIVTIPIILFINKKSKNKEIEEHSNQGKLKSKLALKYLSEAKNQLGNKEPFYLAIEKAMHNFLKAKLNIETSEMSKENIENALIQKKASLETVRQFINVMKSAEFARYAPSTSDSMKQDYEKAIGLLTDLEKQIV